MQEFRSVGDAWVFLVNATVQNGTPMGSEGLELLGASVAFLAAAERDPIVERFGEQALRKLLQRVSSSPATTGDLIIQQVHSHAAGQTQFDDITMVAFGRM